MNSLIGENNYWVLWTVIIGWAAISIVLEQKYKWAAKITGAIIALLGAMFLANLKIIPTSSSVYDTVWDYVIPVAIPLLLFKADIRKIYKESGRMFGMFNISALGTVLGAFVATFIFGGFVPHLYKIAGMITGSYIGGGVNFVAMTAAFNAPENITNATIVADNMVMALYFFMVMGLASSKFLIKRFGLESGENSSENTGAADYWKGKEISLKDIAVSLAVAFFIACISNMAAGYFKSVIPRDNTIMEIINTVFGNMYLIMTTLTLILATIFSKFFSKINGSDEIGTFLIYLFFVVLGIPASIMEILKHGAVLFPFCLLIVAINLLFSLFVGKMFKFRLDEILLSTNAAIGGPTTAAAMAIAKGWNTLIIPVMLSGIWGYILGNYMGVIVGNVLKYITG